MSDNKTEGYSVWVMRRDQAHIAILETSNFDEADKVWKDLKDRWTTALKEQIPFELRNPRITAFDPGLIYEITLLPLMSNVNNDNPYQQQMRQNGFSNTFGKLTKGSDMLDNGYKY